jgi:thiol:disulfide interchange protein DsbC
MAFGSVATLCLSAACLAIGLAPPIAWADSEMARLKGVPLNQAIRIGNGKHVVIEVSDPDCRFSRRMGRYFEMRRDTTRYVFLVALKNHPEAAEKAKYILCASDRAAAYREVYEGGLDFGEKKLDRNCKDQGLFEVHRDVAEKLVITGTPTYFVDGVRVNGAKPAEIDRLLGGEKFPFSADDPD